MFCTFLATSYIDHSLYNTCSFIANFRGSGIRQRPLFKKYFYLLQVYRVPETSTVLLGGGVKFSEMGEEEGKLLISLF